MEYFRGIGVQGKELNLLIQLVEDKIIGAPAASGIPGGGGIPESARCDSSGYSPIPGFRSILIRAINNAVAQVENRIKLALYPRRKTNFARTPQEVYEDRVKYSTGALDSFLDVSYREYPQWSNLEPEQMDMYNNDSTLYTPGTLPWDLLTPEQMKEFASRVLYAPNKTENEERIDGRERSYIKLYERNIIKIHRIALVIQDPMGLGIPYLHRTFDPSEYFLYPIEGAVRLFPAQAKISAVGNGALQSFAGYGMRVPYFSQLIHVDYEHGMERIPPALQEAVALLAASKAFEMLNVAFTKGMLSYSVSGFSASFGEGLYMKTIQRYKEEAEELLGPYYMPVMTAW
ncbi:MAG: hypothetical protein WC965_01970 [Thiohalomonadaceae bacterium]